MTAKTKIACLSATVIAVLLGGVTWRAICEDVHPEFGPIYSAEMIEGHAGNWDAASQWQTHWEKGEATLRRWLGMRQHRAPSQHGLPIGPALLEWSLGGHIYMTDPQPPFEPCWELALSRCAHLAQVKREDLKCDFYGVNDPRGFSVFGPRYQGPNTRTAWEEHAIRVPDGQVFFARLVTNRSTVYVIQLGTWRYFTNQNGVPIGRISVKYARVDEVADRHESPNKVDGANSPPAS